uniref:DNA replication protein n=1 Tax=Pseudomonas phage PA_L9 TaxID=3232177 RepID=A0AAU8KYL7_9CAUD
MTVGLNFLATVVASETGSSLARLEEDLFVGEQEQAAFEFVRRYYRQYRSVPDARTVQEHTGVRLPTPRGDVEFHRNNLYDRRTFDVIRDTYSTLRDAIGTRQPAPAIQALESGLRRVRSTQRNAGLVDLAQGMAEVRQRLVRVQAMGGMSGVPTPWPTLNAETAGYQDADLITFVGRMGTGKTMTLLWQANHVYEEGYSALVVTTEMGSEQIARRWMAMHYGLDAKMLKSGMVSTRLLRQIEQYEAELLGRERFRILSLGTGAQISQIEAAVEELSPDIVFIDGAYLLKPSKQSRPLNRNETAAYVFDEIKQLTIDTNRPWVVNTQFNRAAGKGGKDGTLESIAMSDVIGYHSSIVVAVKHGPTENPYESRELDILKGREGEFGSFFTHYRFKPANLNEMTAEEVEAVSAGPAAAEEDDQGYAWR